MIKNWTGKILVSTPKMGYDSEFSQSVILLYQESAAHVAGIILNKPGKTKTKKILVRKCGQFELPPIDIKAARLHNKNIKNYIVSYHELTLTLH